MPRPPSRAVEALDHHADLLRWWSRSIYAPPFAEGFADTHPDKLGCPLDDYLIDHLDRAETIYVTADITDRLWEFAQNHGTDDLILHPDDLFMDNGYVWFQQPLLITDVRGRVVTIRVLCWFRDPEKLRVFYFNDKMHELDELTRLMEEETGQPAGENLEPRTPLFHFESHPWGQPMFRQSEQMTVDDAATAVQQFDMLAALKTGDGKLEWQNREDMHPSVRMILDAQEKSGADVVRVTEDDETKGAWFFTYNYESKKKDGGRFASDPADEIAALREHYDYLTEKHEGLQEILAKLSEQEEGEQVVYTEDEVRVLMEAIDDLRIIETIPKSEIAKKRRGSFQYHIDPETGKMSDWFTEDTLRKHIEDTQALNRFILALWGWMGEQIPWTVPAPRPTARRLQRAKVSFPSEVQVVDLRAIEQDPWRDANPNPAMIMWSHRWKVREHKRRWFDKHGNYRETTVHAYVKGPKHLPLIERDRVFNVRR